MVKFLKFPEVYGDNALNNRKVKKEVKTFKDDHKNMHDVGRSGFVINDNLVKKVDEKVLESAFIIISKFPQVCVVSRSVLYDILTER